MSVADLPFVFADYWDLVERDIGQIEEDWNTIVDKVRRGLAHELSEGDTLYLGACVKGPGGGTTLRRQPYSLEPAPQRALSFKPVYLNYVVNELLRGASQAEVEQVNSLLEPDEESQGLERVVLDRFKQYIGMTESEIAAALGVQLSMTSKNRRASLSRHILGVSGSGPIAEFERAGIILKTVPLSRGGHPSENMSFPAIDYVSLLDEDWENSELRNLLVNKMLLVYFRSQSGARCRLSDTDCRLDAVMFWHMPEVFIDSNVRVVWQQVVDSVRGGNYDAFPKAKDTGHVFVNTHAVTRDGDQAITPQGHLEKKRSFWLHRSVLKAVYDDHHGKR